MSFIALKYTSPWISSSHITAKLNTIDFSVVFWPAKIYGARYKPSFLLFLLTIGAPNLMVSDSRFLGLRLLK